MLFHPAYLKMMWNNLAKNVSQIQIKAQTTATAMPTTPVYVTTSFLVAQDTFFISATTSSRNFFTITSHPRSY